MYELKSNKKSLESQKIIYKSLRRILLTKHLNKVTVKDICTECGVSRTTFYRNFDNVTDILAVMLEYFYNEYLVKRVGKPNQLLYFFEYWQNHRDLVSIIATQNDAILKECMKRHYTSDCSIYVHNLKFALFSSLLSSWSKSKKETPKEMEEITKEFMNSRCLDALLP